MHGVVAVGASAGGVEALTRLAEGLPEQLPYAVLVVLHLPRDAPSILAHILDRSGPLPAVPASNGLRLTAGQIVVAVPDRHLLVTGSHVVLSEGPTENGHRPAINALFRSVAVAFGPRSIGVLLSGVLDDGVLGAADIRSRGGTIVVQEPSDAQYPAMPINAIRAGVADHRAAAADIGALLAKLAEREIGGRDGKADEAMELENRIAFGRRFAAATDSETLGPHSGYTCPDCNGSLIAVGGHENYRCRVGHAWTAEALLSARDDEVASAMWVAIRSLREKAELSRRMARNLGPGLVADRYTEIAEEAEHAVTLLGTRLSAPGAPSGQRGDG